MSLCIRQDLVLYDILLAYLITDDTYLVIPADNTLTSPAELAHIEAWAGIVTERRLPSYSNSQTYLIPTVCQLRNRLGLSKSLIQNTVDLNSSSATCI